MVKQKRFTLVSDDDGHRYVIPVDMLPKFWLFVEEPEDDEFDFEKYRIDGGTLTFTDPKVE